MVTEQGSSDVPDEPVVADGLAQGGEAPVTPDPPLPPDGTAAAGLDLDPDLDVEAEAGDRVIPDEDVNPGAGTPEPA